MLPFERDRLVARVCAGVVRIRVGPRARLLTLHKASPEDEYEAHEVYAEALEQAELDGLYSDDELYGFMLANGLWDDAREAALAGIPKDIEELKVQLYTLEFKSNERAEARKALAAAKAKLAELQSGRHALSHVTQHGAAAAAKARFLAARCLRPHSPDLVDDALREIARVRIGEAEYREVARTDPWRGVWNARRGGGPVFDGPACRLTDEQRTLLSWTLLYDSIHEHPDCPPPDALEDDDVTDGWLIAQRRKREKGRGANPDDLIGNEKIRGSSEVFMMVDTPEDARKVMGWNDAAAKAVQKARFKTMEDRGTVEEQDMPDTKRNIQMQFTELQKRA